MNLQQGLSVEQLREMAARQQQQIEMQQQQLVAKEQRLKYLKQQEYQHHQMASEYDRLRRLREKVESQELKLKKLRALRGQPDNANVNNNNANLLTDLESIRLLFNEKEKELALAVVKVDELTSQLEELRSGKVNLNYPPQVVELEKLRRELAYRRQLNEQQNNMISQQRAQLSMGQEEMARIDRRIAELQDRLTRKRMMNQQLANQINAATTAKQAQLRAIQAGLSNKNKTKPVSTVEPFQRSIVSPPVDNHHVSAEDLKPTTIHHGGGGVGGGEPEAVINNKNYDPKYQTLPYNTKFGHQGLHNAKAQKIEALKLEKENNNIGFSEGLPRPPPPMYAGGHQGVGVVAPLPQSDQAGQQTPQSSLGKPVSSVAPVFSSTARPGSVQDSMLSPPHLSSTPISATNGGQMMETPTKLRPALPPKPVMGGGGPGVRQSPVPPVHGEDGTSVDDEDLPPPPPTSAPPTDSPTPDSDVLNGNKELCVDVSQPVSLDNSGLKVSATSAESLVHIAMNRRFEMPPAFHFPEDEAPPSDLISGSEYPLLPRDVTDNAAMFPMVNQIYKEFQDLGMEEKEQLMSRSPEESDEYSPDNVPEFDPIPSVNDRQHGVKSIIQMSKKGNIKITGQTRHNRTVSFDPLALLLDASLEGELDLVKKTAGEVTDPSAANDEGITALHNAICAGHLDIVQFLVTFGCDVNAQDSDGWTPLHCAASCNNLAMVRFLVEHGACIFATTLSDHETAAEKCEEDEEGFDGCSEYLYHIQEKLGIINDGIVFGVYDYDAVNSDELCFDISEKMSVMRKGDELEKEWWWTRKEDGDIEGYIPRNLIGLFPRVPARTGNGTQPMEE